MTRTRSLLALSPALPGTALALACSLGSGTAAAATELPAMPQAVQFHKLTLLNGWRSSQPMYGTGRPAVAASGGVVRLSGSLHQPSGNNNEFAVLPPGDRPAHLVYLPVYADGGGEGSLEIAPGGAMYLFGTGNTKGYSSLAGLSFPAGLAAHKLATIHGWQSAQGSYGAGDPAVTASNGIVYLSGSVKQPSGSADEFAVLPKADRPRHWLYLPVYTLDGTEGSLEISPAGHLSLFGGSSTKGFSSLAGISFPVSLAAQQLPLINGWQSAQGSYHTGNPAAAIRDGIVHLSGSLERVSGSQTEVTVLAPAYRPGHYLYLPVYTLDGTEGSLEITPGGAVYAMFGSASGYTSLAGISYPAGL
jgi:hypothetical protein